MVFDQRSYHWGATRPPRYTARNDDPQVVLQNPEKVKDLPSGSPQNSNSGKCDWFNPIPAVFFYTPSWKLSPLASSNSQLRVKSPGPPNF